MSKALYRKYRSKSLDEIVGQSHVTEILKKSLEQGRIAHAYLLTGPRGVGKTSIARILAHEINQLPYTDESNHLDIIEIDAASNNGVDDIRELRDKVQIAPVSAKKKIYIIDEVHMLSKPAFNALLKTLEEPPEHVVFILATTDIDKLPDTIISRTQRFGFHAITEKDAVQHLQHIAKEEKINIADDALQLIARHGGGSFRDSISLLDQLSSLADTKTGVTAELVERVLGLAPRDLVDQLLVAYDAHDLAGIVSLIDDAESRAVPPSVLANQLISQIEATITEKPTRLTLLDQLIEVTRSSQPRIKLLTTLAAGAEPKSKSAALNALATTASIKILEMEATREKPSEARVKPKPAKPVVSNFSWDSFLASIKEHSVALYSIIRTATYQIDDANLLIYCGTKFYKSKVDDARFRAVLDEALLVSGGSTYVLETLGHKAPPRDAKLAFVAALMGGGEEVDVSDENV